MLIALEGSAMVISGSKNETGGEYKNYYVQKTHGLAKNVPRYYHRGPAAGSIRWSMINIKKMAEAAVNFINQNKGKVFMVGWSRGAAACIQTAHYLKRANNGKKIDAMFLFDPVDMDTSTSDNLDFIPDSVINAYHATATKKSKIINIFPTCGKKNAPSVNAVREYFNTTHSGVAGGPDGDDGSWDWMHRYMLQNDVFLP